MSFISQIFLVWFFLSFAYLVRKDLHRGIYAGIFLMPAYLVRFALFGIPTTALEVIIYILFLFWIVSIREDAGRRGNISVFSKEDRMLFSGIALLFLGMIFSTLHSVNLRVSLGALKGWFIDPFLFFIVYISVIKSKKEIRKSLLSFVLSGFAVAAIAIMFALGGSLTFDGRLRAFYESPNYLAMYLTPAFLFAFFLFGFGKRTDKNDRKAQAFILFILLSALLLTRSYGAALGAAAALAFGFLRKYAGQKLQVDNKSKKIFAAAAFIAVALFAFLSCQKAEQIITAGERSSLSSRFMIWNAAGEMLKDSPIIGIGPGTFQQVYLEYQSRFSVPYLEWAVPQPHNTFLAFYLQTGLVGFAGFILILFWLFKRARADDIVFLFLVYFLVHGMIDTLYWKNDLALIFALVLGAAYAGKKKTA